MPEYTYKDVIIDPNDPRVEIGARYFWADLAYDVLEEANTGSGTGILERVCQDDDQPFVIRTDCPCACLIRKKDPKKRHVPFDLSDPEVRKSLRGRWITDGNREEGQITGFLLDSHGKWNATTCDRGLIDAINLQAFWKFDDGTPCGRLVEG